jgi:hypothetical protein
MNLFLSRARWRLRNSQVAVLAIWFVGFGALTVSAQQANSKVQDYYHDFRGRPLPADLNLFNAKGDASIKEEPEGLRITIPETWIHPPNGVGIRTAFGFHGDFEATTTIEILDAQTPPGGFGVGVVFYVAQQGGGGAGINRLMRAGGNDRIVCDQAEKGDLKRFACTDKVLRMRLKRTGTTLAFLWAPGAAGSDFTEIHRCEFGNASIDRIRLAATTGRQPSRVDVRLIDLRVRSGWANDSAPPESSRAWMLWVGLALAALGVSLILGIALAIRRSRGLTGIAAASSTADAGSLTTFTCSGCQSNLRVRAELAGKTVKCPRCGQAVHVPAASAQGPGEPS